MKNENKLVVFDWNGIFDANPEHNGYSWQNAFGDVLRSMSSVVGYKTDIQIVSEYYPWETVLPRMACNYPEYRNSMYSLFKSLDIPTNTESLCMYERLFLKYFERTVQFDDNKRYAYCLGDKVKTALLSDVDCAGLQCLLSSMRTDMFDYVQFSCVSGMTKRKPECFKLVTSRLGVAPEHTLLVDDNAENIAVAQSCGWNVKLLSNPSLTELKNVCEAFIMEG